ncbi:MAG TPA: hypothetical protein VI756_07720 [Blastocatellia bacterium]
MAIHAFRTAAIIVVLTFCTVQGLRSTRKFPEDEHSLGVTRVLVSPPDVSLTSPIKGRLDDIAGLPAVGATVTARGWAVDESSSAPLEQVAVVIDGLEVIPAVTGVERPDVANAFNRPEYANAGWKAEIPLDGILPGEHRIEVIAYGPGGQRTILNGTRYLEVVSVR